MTEINANAKYYVKYGDQPYSNMIEHFRMFPFLKFRVEIKEHKAKRSLDQNALYWMWLGIVGKDLGYKAEELHEALKAKILGVVETKTIFGVIVLQPRSTTTLTVKEFTEYLNAVQAFASALGINLPMPSEFGMDSYNKPRKEINNANVSQN